MAQEGRPPLAAFVNWRTNSTEGSCVEIAETPGGWVAVRDTTDCDGPVLMFNADEWSTFTRWVRSDLTV
jgi:hypothetical protein